MSSKKRQQQKATAQQASHNNLQHKIYKVQKRKWNV